MSWEINFISRDDFKEHVTNTIRNYDKKLQSYDLKRFNSNLIDPVKMIFDKTVYGQDWFTVISNEIFRQRDKSNTNEIGYFHQRLFDYINNCHVPINGKEGGWDVIVSLPTPYKGPDGDEAKTIYVEMKNKHNTMNSAASGKTYIKMQNQLLKDDDCFCFLVEAIAKQSQNITWRTTVDGQKVSHKRIRRVSLDQFYEIVTGDPKAFYKICVSLPEIIEEILIETNSNVSIPHDTVFSELRARAAKMHDVPEDPSMALSMYLLGFSTYIGFDELEEKLK